MFVRSRRQPPSASRRGLAPFADKHNMIVAVHGHADIKNPEQISTEETFLKCFAASKNIWANLDIGHYTAAGLNPVDFLQKHHGRITNLHVKDRKNLANGQANVPFGQGDTPVQGSAAASEEEQVGHRRQHRVRVHAERTVGRNAEVSAVHSRSARLTLREGRGQRAEGKGEKRSREKVFPSVLFLLAIPLPSCPLPFSSRSTSSPSVRIRSTSNSAY